MTNARARGGQYCRCSRVFAQSPSFSSYGYLQHWPNKILPILIQSGILVHCWYSGGSSLGWRRISRCLGPPQPSADLVLQPSPLHIPLLPLEPDLAPDESRFRRSLVESNPKLLIHVELAPSALFSRRQAPSTSASLASHHSIFLTSNPAAMRDRSCQ